MVTYSELTPFHTIDKQPMAIQLAIHLFIGELPCESIRSTTLSVPHTGISPSTCRHDDMHAALKQAQYIPVPVTSSSYT